jgi:hypothetical protein
VKWPGTLTGTRPRCSRFRETLKTNLTTKLLEKTSIS